MMTREEIVTDLHFMRIECADHLYAYAPAVEAAIDQLSLEGVWRFDGEAFRCSACGKAVHGDWETSPDYAYCPHCGAVMNALDQ